MIPNSRGTRQGWPLPGQFVLAVLVVIGACSPQRPATGPFPQYAEFQGQEVRQVSFTGDLVFSRDSLRAVIRTRPSRCRFLFLPICVPFTRVGREEYRLDLGELARDVARIQLYHRDHGYYGSQVAPRVEPLAEDRVGVEFAIMPGRQVILQELVVEGVDPILPREEVTAAMPLEVGEPFGRLDFLASADTLQARLLQRGHAYAEVLRNFMLDTIAGVAQVEFVALPGPLVFVDTIIFEGNERLSERTLRRQITFSEGDVVQAVELNRTQRNLYNLGMVNFASVQLAPDTLELGVAEEDATVLVQVVEAAQYALEASAGFGTVDCFRTEGRVINRNFLGGGRRLEASGSLSRIGVGSPTDLGLGGRICTNLREEGFLGVTGFDVADDIDYRLTANFQQPNIFGTQNQLAVNLNAERTSESEAYIRESVGGRVAAVRELDRGPTLLTTIVDVERGRTVANPALLCVGFDTCSQEDLDLLRQYRWSNALTFAAARDHTLSDGILSRHGYVIRGSLDWASPILFSDDDYLRLLLEGSRYRRLRPGWALMGNVRIGRFLRGGLGREHGYIPPERRFYAGGPNSVRGYARNALGPTSYIIPPTEAQVPDDENTIGSATGGTQLLTSSVELNTPSPWLSDVMRLAAFVDAGHLSAPGTEFLAGGGLRFTPGVGVRFLTPVGPFRLDLAYNPYPREAGPRYWIDPRIGLILRDASYQPDPPSFLGRFRFQFALGQAF
jgi:outer membrane protein assembly factor BamA